MQKLLIRLTLPQLKEGNSCLTVYTVSTFYNVILSYRLVVQMLCFAPHNVMEHVMLEVPNRLLYVAVAMDC